MQRRLHRAESLDHLLPGAQDDLSTPSDSRRASEDEAETKERDSRQGSFAAPLETRKADRRFSGWKRWTLILAILVGGLLAIVGAGGLWVYKSAPPDGQSPPWYPTRKWPSALASAPGCLLTFIWQLEEGVYRTGKMPTQRLRQWSAS